MSVFKNGFLCRMSFHKTGATPTCIIKLKSIFIISHKIRINAIFNTYLESSPGHFNNKYKTIMNPTLMHWIQKEVGWISWKFIKRKKIAWVYPMCATLALLVKGCTAPSNSHIINWSHYGSKAGQTGSLQNPFKA